MTAADVVFITMAQPEKALEAALGTSGQDNERFLKQVRARLNR